MTHTTTGTLIGLGAAAFLAWWIGGSLGTGLLAGCLAGASVAGVSIAWQRRVLATHPEKLVTAAVAGFLLKLAAVLAGVLALRFLDSEARIADWRSFVVAFAVAAVLVLIPGTLEVVRKLGIARVRKEPVS
jgi:MFS family permease